MNVESTQGFSGHLSATLYRGDGTVEEIAFRPLLWKEKLYLDTRALFRRIWEKLT